MKQFFWQLLYFNQTERKGIAVLAFIIVASILYPRYHSYFFPRKKTDFSEIEAIYRLHFLNDSENDSTSSASSFAFSIIDPNSADYEKWLSLGLPPRTARSICNYRDKGGRFRQPEDLKKIYTLSQADYERILPWIKISGKDDQNEMGENTPMPQYAFFDPNNVNEQLLAGMQLPRHTVRGWLNYLSKGGKFKYQEDLKKLYQLSEADYLRIAPYIDLPSKSDAVQAATFSGGGEAPFEKKGRQAYAILDVNTADEQRWDALPGIGAAWAARIVKYREKLGGFYAVEQVKETKGLPDSLFQKAAPYLQIQSSTLVTLNLNTVTRKDLEIHPYFDRTQANWIVAYREQHGPYKQVNDLLNITTIEQRWFQKVKPYLRVE